MTDRIKSYLWRRIHSGGRRRMVDWIIAYEGCYVTASYINAVALVCVAIPMAVNGGTLDDMAFYNPLRWIDLHLYGAIGLVLAALVRYGLVQRTRMLLHLVSIVSACYWFILDGAFLRSLGFSTAFVYTALALNAVWAVWLTRRVWLTAPEAAYNLATEVPNTT